MATYKLTAKDLMSKKPKYYPPSATLKEIASEMQASDFGFIPIGENDRLIGTVTDRDIAIRAVAKGKDPNKTLAKDVMTKDVCYCFENDDLDKIAKMMEGKQIRRLIVLNDKEHKRMTGILSLGDIALKSDDMFLNGEIVEEVSRH